MGAQPTHTGITRAIVSFVINLLQPESLTRDDHIDDDAMASKGNKEQKWEKLDDETLVTATATTVTDATEQQQSIFNKLKSFLMFGKSKNKNADSSVEQQRRQKNGNSLLHDSTVATTAATTTDDDNNDESAVNMNSQSKSNAEEPKRKSSGAYADVSQSDGEEPTEEDEGEEDEEDAKTSLLKGW